MFWALNKGPIHFVARCCKRWLNRALSVLFVSSCHWSLVELSFQGTRCVFDATKCSWKIIISHCWCMQLCSCLILMHIDLTVLQNIISNSSTLFFIGNFSWIDILIWDYLKIHPVSTELCSSMRWCGGDSHSSKMCPIIYTLLQSCAANTGHPTLAHNFAKCSPIFKMLPPSDW